MTSPYAWYQYFVNTADADVVRYLRWFTFLVAGRIGGARAGDAERPHERAAQRRLARELTDLVHGEAATASVEHASQALFGRGELAQLDEPTLAAALREASGGRTRRRAAPMRSPTCWWPAACRRARARRRRTIGEGGAYVNNVRIESEEWVAAALGLPAWSLAGAAPRQAEYRRRRTRWLDRRARHGSAEN